jgi:carboxypeptidase Taq
MSLDNLLNHLKESAALHQIAELISWDQDAMMPKDGAEQRAEQAAVLAAIIHHRKTDPRIPEWIDEIDTSTICGHNHRNICEAQRSFKRSSKIPASLASEIAKAASKGRRIWIEAREENNFHRFVPALKKIVYLKQQEAACLNGGDRDLYDCLLDDYEPNTTTVHLDKLFGCLREELIVLRNRALSRPQPKSLNGHFPKAGQLALAETVANHLGYNFDAGRIDLVVHPRCMGCAGDVRITTRVNEQDPFLSLYMTIHEVGHALYAQGIHNPFMPCAKFCSYGVDESQSRFWENQIARSRPFVNWLYPKMNDIIGPLSLSGPEELYAAINRVKTNFIRLEADEISYNLHVLMRYDLERQLISGQLPVEDLEAAWNERFLQDFGVEVPNPRLGVLQDVHWTLGYFGYFPTYVIGNIYAACLEQALNEQLPDYAQFIEDGNTGIILNWLREKIHIQGRVLPAAALMKEATGQDPSVIPLLAYLKDKLAELYDI